MTVNKKISLVAVDTISAFYWEDVVKLNGLRKKDLYLKIMMQKLENAVKEHKIVTIIVRPGFHLFLFFFSIFLTLFM